MPPRLPIGTADPESSLQSTCRPLLRQHSLPTQLLSQTPSSWVSPAPGFLGPQVWPTETRLIVLKHKPGHAIPLPCLYLCHRRRRCRFPEAVFTAPWFPAVNCLILHLRCCPCHTPPSLLPSDTGSYFCHCLEDNPSISLPTGTHQSGILLAINSSISSVSPHSHGSLSWCLSAWLLVCVSSGTDVLWGGIYGQQSAQRWTHTCSINISEWMNE